MYNNITVLFYFVNLFYISLTYRDYLKVRRLTYCQPSEALAVVIWDSVKSETTLSRGFNAFPLYTVIKGIVGLLTSRLTALMCLHSTLRNV